MNSYFKPNLGRCRSAGTSKKHVNNPSSNSVTPKDLTAQHGQAMMQKYFAAYNSGDRLEQKRCLIASVSIGHSLD